MVITILLARRLAPDAYGQFVFVQWVIELCGLVCSFGVAGSMTRFLPTLSAETYSVKASLIRIFAWLNGAAMVLSTIVFFFYLILFHKSNGEGLWWFLCWSTTSLLSTLVNAALQGLFRYDAVTVANITFVAIGASLVVLLPPSIVHAVTAMSLAYGASASAGIATCVVRRGTRRRLASQIVPSLRSIAAYSANTWLTGLLATLVWSRGEFAILKWRLQSSDIAIYSAALSLNGVITQGSGLLTGALTPHVASHLGSGDEARIGRLLQVVTQTVMLFATAASIGLIATGSSIVPLILGDKYRASYDVLCILVISGISISLGCAYTILQVELHGSFGRNVNIISLIVLLSLSATLTPFIGIMGAAIARLLAQLIASGLILWRLARVDYLRSITFRISRTFAASTAIVLAYYVFVKVIHIDLVPQLIVATACVGALIWTIRVSMGQRILAIVNL